MASTRKAQSAPTPVTPVTPATVTLTQAQLDSLIQSAITSALASLTATATPSTATTTSTKSSTTTRKSRKSTTSAPSTANQPVVWVCNKAQVTYTYADGTYVYPRIVRQALNLRLREAGAEYSDELHAWVFPSTTKATAFVKKVSTVLSEADVKAVTDKWAERKARKEAKVASKTK